MLCHDVGDVLEHLKGEHIEVRGILITVSDCLSERIEILIDISVELDAINTRNGGRCLEGYLLFINLYHLCHTHTITPLLTLQASLQTALLHHSLPQAHRPPCTNQHRW